MLSPLVAGLQKQRQKDSGTGKITGDVFFWSTLGSIAGSLVSGFVLIPLFGVDRIIIGAGIVLLAVGLAGIIFSGKDTTKRVKFLSIIIGISCIEAILICSYTNTTNITSLYRKDGVYEKLTIYDGSYQGRPTRFFMQDRSSSGAIFLHSSDLVYDYTKYYKLYKIFNPDIKRALFIGGR